MRRGGQVEKRCAAVIEDVRKRPTMMSQNVVEVDTHGGAIVPRSIVMTSGSSPP